MVRNIADIAADVKAKKKITEAEKAALKRYIRLEKKRQYESLSYEERNRLKTARRDRELQESVRNIGSIPVINNIKRRSSCRESLLTFIETYFMEGLNPFSEDHLRIIRRTQSVITEGGRLVEAVYRGFGKSTLSRIAIIWALFYGYTKFAPLISATSDAAERNLDSIKILMTVPELMEDFPEITFPVDRLQGIAQRAKTQLYNPRDSQTPELTNIHWSGEMIALPSTDGAYDEFGEWHDNKASGGLLLSCGLLSKAIRGMNVTHPVTRVGCRPDFCIIDDPQDEESASSPVQIVKRMNVIRKSIIRSASHQKGIGIIMPCTVIQHGDLVDQLLDHKRNPAWQGERVPFVRKWADRNDDLWMDKYKELRTTYDNESEDDYKRAIKDANAFYAANRAVMDAGSEVSWEHCFESDKGEISAIQHAYNALIDDGEEVFATEFQNEPYSPPEEEGQLTSDVVFQRIRDNITRGQVPDSCHKLTCFVDVQKNCLFWAVMAFEPWFTGYIIDYGVYPQQISNNFTLRDIKITLAHKHQGMGQEATWRAGLEYLTEALLTKEYIKDDGSPIRITRLMIDANDGNATQTIYTLCRQSQFSQLLLPSMGKAVSASGTPFSDYKRKPGDYVSPYNWRIPSPVGKPGSTRYMYADVNYWKSFTRSRFYTATGDRGCIHVFGKEKNGARTSHMMFADHMTSEYSVRTSGRGRSVDEWSLRPNRENHWFDCIVGCMIAASEQGIILGDTDHDKVSRMKNKSRKDKLAALGRVLG